MLRRGGSLIEDLVGSRRRGFVGKLAEVGIREDKNGQLLKSLLGANFF